MRAAFPAYAQEEDKSEAGQEDFVPTPWNERREKEREAILVAFEAVADPEVPPSAAVMLLNEALGMIPGRDPRDLVDDQGNTPLHKLVKSANTGFNPKEDGTGRNIYDSDTRTLTKEIIGLGIDVNAFNKGGYTAIIYEAVREVTPPPEIVEKMSPSGSIRRFTAKSVIAEEIINAPAFQVDIVPKWDRTALASAAWKGNVALVAMLLEKGADPNKAPDGTPAIQLAVNMGTSRLGQINWLEDKLAMLTSDVILGNLKTDISSSAKRDIYFHAASTGRTGIMQKIEGYGYQFRYDHTQIYAGVKLNIWECVMRTGRWIRNTNPSTRKNRPFSARSITGQTHDIWMEDDLSLIQNKNPERVIATLEYLVLTLDEKDLEKFFQLTGRKEQPPLLVALHFGAHPVVLDWMLDHTRYGLDIHATDENEQNAIHYAVRNAGLAAKDTQREELRMLLNIKDANGTFIDMNHIDSFGMTPLDLVDQLIAEQERLSDPGRFYREWKRYNEAVEKYENKKRAERPERPVPVLEGQARSRLYDMRTTLEDYGAKRSAELQAEQPPAPESSSAAESAPHGPDIMP